MTSAAQVSIEPSEEEQNLWLKWQGMTPEQRAAWREGMSLAERSTIRRRIAADCKKLAEQVTEAQAATKPNGSGEPNGASAAEAASEIPRLKKLRRLFLRLPAEQRDAVEAQFNRRNRDD